MIEATTRALIRIFKDLFLAMYPDIFKGLSDDVLPKELMKRVILNADSIVEISELPAIVLNGPILNEKKRLIRDAERITAIDEETGQARREIPPRWYDLHFDLNFSCESNFELIRFIEFFSRLNQGYTLLNAKNERVRQYLWRWETPPQVITIPNISQVYQGHARIIVYDVEVYSGIHEDVPLIQIVSGEINDDRIEVQS